MGCAARTGGMWSLPEAHAKDLALSALHPPTHPQVVHLNLRLETVLARKDVEGRLVYLTGLEYGEVGHEVF